MGRYGRRLHKSSIEDHQTTRVHETRQSKQTANQIHFSLLGSAAFVLMLKYVILYSVCKGWRALIPFTVHAFSSSSSQVYVTTKDLFDEGVRSGSQKRSSQTEDLSRSTHQPAEPSLPIRSRASQPMLCCLQ